MPVELGGGAPREKKVYAEGEVQIIAREKKRGLPHKSLRKKKRGDQGRKENLRTLLSREGDREGISSAISLRGGKKNMGPYRGRKKKTLHASS